MYTGFVDKELNKCLLCKNPLCRACPAGTTIPEVIALVRAGKTGEAQALLFDNNPLSAITGAVCPNHLYCHGACVLGRKGSAVDFGKIEREISGKYLENYKGNDNTKFSEKNKTDGNESVNAQKILIAGSGPAGLALAYYLNKQGHKVTVYEKEQRFGGMLRYGIPDFRLDKTLIDKLVKVLSGLGIEFKNKTSVDICALEPYKKDFDIIVIAVGAGVSKKLAVPGAELGVPALEYLKNPKRAEKVIVIGAGNVAIDCTLTACELGAKTVNLCYRRDEAAMKAYPEELELARSKGVKFNYFMVPKKLYVKKVSEAKNGKSLQTAEQQIKAVFENSGKNVTKTGGLVVLAIGQTASEINGKTTNCDIKIAGSGLIEADGFKTNIKNVYALGDAVTGPSTVIKAVAAAKQLAEIIKAGTIIE